MKLVLASQNEHKIRELQSVLPEGWELISAAAAGIEGELTEEGATLEANARQKSEYVYTRTGIPSLADDSGLEVFYLGGRPGVDSACYAGIPRSDAANKAKLLAELHGAPDRSARFTTVLSWTTAEGTHQVTGRVNGSIAHEERGTAGFGYDALFVPDELDGRTFAECTDAEKQAISHRTRAVAAWLDFIQKS